MSSGPSGPPSARLPQPGDLVGGKYVLQSMIGQGGMGAVYKARHNELEHEVAIKVMFADANNVEAATRFKNEGRAAARIKSDHVMKVHDVGQELNYLYMVLELLEGKDLGQVLESTPGGKLPWGEAVKWVLEALEGVEKAHALGIVHRDLKPSNLYLANDPDAPGGVTVKVLDFGISKASGNSALNQSPSALTSTKAMLGSPLYMSPEQLRSSKNVDARADIWAIGVILYETITGTLPFMGDNLGELFANILETDATSLTTRGANVPPELDAVILKCLKRKPEDRHQSVRELMTALRPYAAAGTAPLHGTAFMAHSPFAPNPHVSTGGFASTPQPRPMPPPQGAITGSGSAPRAHPGQPGTMAMAQTPSGGAVPHPHVQQPFPGAGVSTNSSWQQDPALVPTNKPPVALIGGIVAGLAVVGIIFGVVAMRSKKTDVDPTVAIPPASASIASPVVSATTPTPVETASATPTASVTAATVTPTTTTTAVVQPVVAHTSNVKPTPTQPPVVKIDPPKPTETAKVTPPTPTTVKTNGSGSSGGGVGVTTRN